MLVAAVPLLILVGGALTVVSGYRLEADGLSVERPLWTTRVSLAGLDRAWHDPSAVCRSIRLFGNGGLFSVTGWFRNPTLGRYRAFVTDPAKAVVLRSPARTLVVSPEDPIGFLAQVGMTFPRAAVGGPSPPAER